MSVACPLPGAAAVPTLRHPFIVRALSSADASACETFAARLDRDDVRRRFGTARCNAAYFLPAQYRDGARVSLAAVDGADTILGILTLADIGTGTGEIALIVRSDHQRRGVGRALLAHGFAFAQSDGLSELIGYVLAENGAMLRLARRMGFALRRWDQFFVEVRRSLGPQAS